MNFSRLSFGRLAAQLLWPLLISCAFISSSQAQNKDVPSVGVFYYPGWHDNAKGLTYALPWEKIKSFPEKKPLLGWYDDADPEVLSKQLRWMSSYGIDYVVFDWYWDGRSTFGEQALQAYFKTPERTSLPFAIMWANHDAQPVDDSSYRKMVQYWIDNYLKRPEYIRLNGYPVVFIYSSGSLETRAAKFGSNGAALLKEANAIAVEAGLPGIHFSLGGAASTTLSTVGRRWGGGSYFAYNYHAGALGFTGEERRVSRSFSELAAGYKSQWDWFFANSDLPLWVPVTAGWNKKPWGGSPDPLHDNSESKPAEFSVHLNDAYSTMSKNHGKSFNSILVCCWNEYGEGSVIEPTEAYGFAYLEAIKKLSPGKQHLK